MEYILVDGLSPVYLTTSPPFSKLPSSAERRPSNLPPNYLKLSSRWAPIEIRALLELKTIARPSLYPK